MINFRAGLESIDKASATQTEASRGSAKVTDYLTKKAEDRDREQTANIVGGLDGIGKAMRQKETDAQVKETHEMDMKDKSIAQKFQEQTFETRKGKLEADKTSMDLSNASALRKGASEELKAKQESTALTAKADTIRGDMSLKIPDAIKGDDTKVLAWYDTQSGLATDKRTVAKEDTALAAAKTGIKATEIGTENAIASNKRSQANEKRLDTQSSINVAENKMQGESHAMTMREKDIKVASDMISMNEKLNPGASKAKMLADNPGAVNDPVGTKETNESGYALQKTQDEKFKGIEKASLGSYSTVQNKIEVGKLLGVQPDSKGRYDIQKATIDGRPLAEVIKFDPNNPKLAQIKQRMTKGVMNLAATGAVASINSNADFRMAGESFGGDFTKASEGNYAQAVDFLFKEDKVQSFFNVQDQVREGHIKEQALFFSNPDNTSHLSKGRIAQVVYQDSPMATISPDVAQDGPNKYMTPDQFNKVTGAVKADGTSVDPYQAQFNNTYGTTVDGAPNVVLSDDYKGKAAAEAEWRDPIKSAERVLASQSHSSMQPGIFNDPKNVALATTLRNNSAGYALANGQIPSDPVTPSGNPSGPRLNLSTSPPNTPVTVGKNGNVQVVSSPSGGAAAGATPTNKIQVNDYVRKHTGGKDPSVYKSLVHGIFGASDSSNETAGN